MYTEEEISELINCQKEITISPKEQKDSRGSRKRGFSLRSSDGKHEFGGFISQNITFQENYSIGLFYKLKNEKGTVVLLRCNGLHGGTKDIPHHKYCHVHTVTADDINNNIKVERNIEKVKDYVTIEEAIQYFIKRINIIPSDRRKHFPAPNGLQGDLFKELN